MFDLSWAHLAVIAVVTLLVIGPKDLPRVLRTVGVWVGKARAIAREFQGSFDQMMREAELEEMRRQVEETANVDLGHEIRKTIDPVGDLEKNLSEPALSGSPSHPPEPLVPAAPAPIAPPPPEASEPLPVPAKSAAQD